MLKSLTPNNGAGESEWCLPECYVEWPLAHYTLIHWGKVHLFSHDGATILGANELAGQPLLKGSRKKLCKQSVCRITGKALQADMVTLAT